MAVVMGVLPGVFLKPMQPSVERFLQRVSRQTVAENPAPRAGATGGIAWKVPAN
jgi:hypothetical protein